MAVKLLDAVDVLGVSPVWNVRMKPEHHTVEIEFTGSPSAVTLSLEGSLRKEGFVSLADHVLSVEELAAGRALFHVQFKTVRAVRLNLSVFTGGTNPELTATYEGINA